MGTDTQIDKKPQTDRQIAGNVEFDINIRGMGLNGSKGKA